MAKPGPQSLLLAMGALTDRQFAEKFTFKRQEAATKSQRIVDVAQENLFTLRAYKYVLLEAPLEADDTFYLQLSANERYCDTRTLLVAVRQRAKALCNMVQQYPWLHGFVCDVDYLKLGSQCMVDPRRAWYLATATEADIIGRYKSEVNMRMLHYRMRCTLAVYNCWRLNIHDYNQRMWGQQLGGQPLAQAPATALSTPAPQAAPMQAMAAVASASHVTSLEAAEDSSSDDDSDCRDPGEYEFFMGKEPRLHHIPEPSGRLLSRATQAAVPSPAPAPMTAPQAPPAAVPLRCMLRNHAHYDAPPGEDDEYVPVWQVTSNMLTGPMVAPQISLRCADVSVSSDEDSDYEEDE